MLRPLCSHPCPVRNAHDQTLTPAGYGDITPYTNVEMGITLLYMLIGVAYFGFLIGVVSELLRAAGPGSAAAAVQERLQASGTCP